jgi:hypothetical protein
MGTRILPTGLRVTDDPLVPRRGAAAVQVPASARLRPISLSSRG